MSPGIDLSLLSNDELRAQSAIDPWGEHERFATGSPVEITDLARAFAEAGNNLDLARELSDQSQRLIGENYTNNGTPMFDERTHGAQLPKDLKGAGDTLVSIAKRLDTIADDLAARTEGSFSRLLKLRTALYDVNTRWEAEVGAATGPDGRIPEADVAALHHARERRVGEQLDLVRAAGTDIRSSIEAYERNLSGGLKMLSDVGYLPPSGFDPGPGGFSVADAARDAAAVESAVTDGPGPDTLQRIDRGSAAVEELNRKVAAGGTLTDQEIRYLNQFYTGLGPDTLARLEGTVTAAAPSADKAGATLAPLANGVMNLSRFEPVKEMPASVMGLVNQPVGMAPPPTTARGGSRSGLPLAIQDRDGKWRVDGLARYQGVADLLSRSTVTGGTDFTKALGESAIRTQQAFNRMADGDPQAGGMVRGGGRADLAAAYEQDVAPLRAMGERPANQMLELVARNPGASQALLSDAGDRHALLGAGWKDQTAAASVLRSATAPAQATPELATGSAHVAKTMLTELGEDPDGWRRVIPKGSELNKAVVEMAADRIDAFSSTPGYVTAEGVDQARRNADGSWTAGFQLGKEGPTSTADDRVQFLKFVGHGIDLDNPRGDVDMQRLHAAADTYIVDQLAEAARHPGGDGPLTVLRDAGNLDGVLFRSGYESLVDQGVKEDKAAQQVYENRMMAVTLAERTVAVMGTAGVSAPINAITKDNFNAAFDRVLLQAVPPPSPLSPARADEWFMLENQRYPDYRSYLVVQAMDQADTIPGTRPPELFAADGTLRPFEDLRDESQALDALNNLATKGPPGAQNWTGGLESGGVNRDAYQPGVYAPVEDPRTPIDEKETRDRLRYGPDR